MCERNSEWVVTPAQMREGDYHSLRDLEDEIWG